MNEEHHDLDSLRAEHLAAREVLQWAKARLESATVALAHYGIRAAIAEQRLTAAIKAANRVQTRGKTE